MNLIQRVTNISLNPKTEWEVIAPEATSTGDLYRTYIVPLAAIGPAASFVGLTVIGVGGSFFGHYRVPMMWALSHAVTQYVFALVGIYLLALLIDALAPSFGAEKNKLQALKLSAYASTPAWVAGVLLMLPALGALAVLAALYSLYLLYLGLPVLMKAPGERTLGYTAVVVVCAVGIAIASGVIAGAVVGVAGAPMFG